MGLLRISFGHEQSAVQADRDGVELTLMNRAPVGAAVSWPVAATTTAAVGPVSTATGAGWRAGALVMPVDTPANLSARTEAAYDAIFAAAEGRHLCRLWNFVPSINAGSGDAEPYRQFNLGRARAVSRAWGEEAPRHLAAASAVGHAGPELAIAFLAADEHPALCENPRQVPAWQYPRSYGPRPPSFSRAAVVARGDEQVLLLSGTAAVVGHASTGGNSLAAQIATTLDNIAALQAHLGPPFADARALTMGTMLVYLRDFGECAEAARLLHERWGAEGPALMFVEADICRRELKIEIEGIIGLPAAAATPLNRAPAAPHGRASPEH